MSLRYPRTALPIAILGLAQAVYGQDDTYINQLKAELGFSTWPPVGGGPLKRGLAFVLSDYPSLAGFVITGDSLVTDFATYGLIRQVELTRGSEQMDISIGVGPDSTTNGHELFIRSGPASQQLAYTENFQRGDPLGLQIGDLNFISQDATPPDVGAYIGFMRNNVMCILRNATPDGPLSVDLGQLATAIDAKIMAQPDLTPAQFDAGRPDIVTFTSADTTLQATEDASTTMNVVVVDHTTPPQPVSRTFQSDGNFTIVDTGTTVTVSPTSTLGLLPLQLFASNPLLQFRTATLSILVTE